MSDKPDDPFRHRYNPDGVYASCFDQFSSSSESLSQMDYPTDFIEVTEPWPDAAGNYTTHFVVPNKEPPTEINIALFGEVLSEREGTALGAMGTKRGTTTITLATKVRDKISLGVPTRATDDLSALYHDQIRALDRVFNDLTVPGPPDITKYPWTTFKLGEVGRNRNVIGITLPLKYAAGRPSTKLRRRQSDMDVSGSKSDEVREDAKYEPSMMHDYEATLFDLGEAHLVQQKMYDEHSQLIPPWKAPFVLAPGTLIAVDANLVVYHFLTGDEKARSHRFQIVANQIMVLDPSPLPYKPVKRVTLKKAGSGSQSSLFEKMLKRKAGDA